MLRATHNAETRKRAERLKQVFIAWCTENDYRKAIKTLNDDWDRMLAQCDFPSQHWVHIMTANVVESAFASLRLPTNAAKRYKKVDRAVAVIWKLLMVAERRFRRLNAPELPKAVYGGGRYVDEIPTKGSTGRAAA